MLHFLRRSAPQGTRLDRRAGGGTQAWPRPSGHAPAVSRAIALDPRAPAFAASPPATGCRARDRLATAAFRGVGASRGRPGGGRSPAVQRPPRARSSTGAGRLGGMGRNVWSARANPALPPVTVAWAAAPRGHCQRTPVCRPESASVAGIMPLQARQSRLDGLQLDLRQPDALAQPVEPDCAAQIGPELGPLARHRVVVRAQAERLVGPPAPESGAGLLLPAPGCAPLGPQLPPVRCPLPPV